MGNIKVYKILQQSIIYREGVQDKMKKMFSDFATHFRQRVAKPFANYLSTPVGKITVLNTVLFVCYRSCRPSGKPKDYLGVF